MALSNVWHHWTHHLATRPHRHLDLRITSLFQLNLWISYFFRSPILRSFPQFFLKYGEQMKNSPGYLIRRDWSPFAKWLFRGSHSLILISRFPLMFLASLHPSQSITAHCLKVNSLNCP